MNVPGPSQQRPVKKIQRLILRDDEIVETIATLQRRISDRFPSSGLSNLCLDLLAVAKEASERSNWISRPIFSIRLIGYLLALGLLGLLVLFAIYEIKTVGLNAGAFDFADFIQTFDAGVSASIFVCAAIYFLISIERRIKRRRALEAVHELRAFAHIIDMHQLTKDPERVLRHFAGTENSPKQKMTPLQLNRYLDYCSEMLSLVGKIAALYIQRFDDGEAVAAVSEVEQLSTGLSRKIWQKIMILNRVRQDIHDAGNATSAQTEDAGRDHDEQAGATAQVENRQDQEN